MFIMLVVSSCTKNEELPGKDDLTFKIGRENVTLKFRESYQFELFQGKTQLGTEIYNWTSSNEKVGKVDYQGKFTAERIGTTTIRAVGRASAPSGVGTTVEATVVVVPTSNYLTEPFFNINDTWEITKQKEKRKFGIQMASGFAFEGGNPDIRSVMYFFGEAGTDRKMVGATVLFSNIGSPDGFAETYIMERYRSHYNIGSYRIYTDDEKVIIAFYYHPFLGRFMIYAPYTGENDVEKNIDKVRDIISKNMISYPNFPY
jgi:hypothetical protein